jgi:hypothetical protein
MHLALTFAGSYKIRNRKQLVNRETEKDKFKEVIDEDQIIEGSQLTFLLFFGCACVSYVVMEVALRSCYSFACFACLDWGFLLVILSML